MGIFAEEINSLKQTGQFTTKLQPWKDTSFAQRFYETGVGKRNGVFSDKVPDRPEMSRMTKLVNASLVDGLSLGYTAKHFGKDTQLSGNMTSTEKAVYMGGSLFAQLPYFMTAGRLTGGLFNATKLTPLLNTMNVTTKAGSVMQVGKALNGVLKGASTFGTIGAFRPAEDAKERAQNIIHEAGFGAAIGAGGLLPNVPSRIFGTAAIMGGATYLSGGEKEDIMINALFGGVLHGLGEFGTVFGGAKAPTGRTKINMKPKVEYKPELKPIIEKLETSESKEQFIESLSKQERVVIEDNKMTKEKFFNTFAEEITFGAESKTSQSAEGKTPEQIANIEKFAARMESLSVKELLEISKKLGVEISIRPKQARLRGGALGWFSAGKKEIRIATKGMSGERMRSVLAHEIGHAVDTKLSGKGIKSTLDDVIKNPESFIGAEFGDAKKASIEVQADLKSELIKVVDVVRGAGGEKGELGGITPIEIRKLRARAELKKVLESKKHKLGADAKKRTTDNYIEQLNRFARYLKLSREQFADAASLYFTNPTRLQTIAPKLYKTMNFLLSQDPVLRDLRPLQKTDAVLPHARNVINSNLEKTKGKILDKDIKSTDVQLEQALTSTKGGAKGFVANVARNAVAIGKQAANWFKFEPTLEKFPWMLNEVRKLQDVAMEANYIGVNAVKGVIGPLNGAQTKIFNRMVLLQDFIESARRGEAIPVKGEGPQVLAELKAEYSRLLELSGKEAGPVVEALGRHNRLMQAYGEDLVARGKIPIESLREGYINHTVLDYSFGRDFSWLDKRFRAPFRQYGKKRYGSIKEIETDYKRNIQKHVSQIEIDNMIDDLFEQISRKYNVKAPESILAKTGGKVVPNQLYDINGKLYKGWQYDPGNHFYRQANTTEGAIQQVVSEVSPKTDLVVGGKKKVYLLPEEVADRLTKFKTPSRFNAIGNTLINSTGLWKRITLDAAGVPFHFNNIFGDLINLWREDPKAFLKIPEATRIVRNTDLNPTERVQRILDIARQERVTEGRTTMTEEFAGRAVSTSAPEGIDRFNPLNWIEFVSAQREAIPRLSKLITDLDRIDAGKQVVARAIDIKGLEPIQQAGKVAREFTVDYGKLSPEFRSNIRGFWFPFATFYAENTRNWFNYVKKNPVDFAVKFLTPYVAMQYWNNTRFPDVEKNLPDYLRLSAHINTGYKTDEGKPIVISFQDPATLAFQTIGADHIADNIRKVATGELTAEEAAYEQIKNTAMGTPELAISLLNPLIKSFGEVAMNRNLFYDSPIVPMALEGTPEGDKLMRDHVIGSLITPYAAYVQSSKTSEEDLTFTRMLKRFAGFTKTGGTTLPTGIGVKAGQSIQQSVINREYELGDELDRKANSALAKVEDAFIRGFADDDMTAVVDEIVRQAHTNISEKDIERRLTSDSMIRRILKITKRETDDPKIRREIQEAINFLTQEASGFLPRVSQRETHQEMLNKIYGDDWEAFFGEEVPPEIKKIIDKAVDFAKDTLDEKEVEDAFDAAEDKQEEEKDKLKE